MAPRVCMIPTNGDETEPTATPTILSLPHPRTSTPTRYLLHPTKGLYELTKISAITSQPRSWLLTSTKPATTTTIATTTSTDENNDNSWIGTGQVLEDGAFYMSTPLDPLFLVLPPLLPPVSEKKKPHFLPLDDIIESLSEAGDTSDKPTVHWGPIVRAGTVTRRHIEARIRAVCEAADADGEKAYRISEEKVLAILARKCEAMATSGLPKSLEDEFVVKPLVRPVTSASLVEDAGKTTELEVRGGDLKVTVEAMQNALASSDIIRLLRLRVASQFLAATYLPPHIATLLTAHLTSIHDFASLDAYLQELKKLRADAAASRSGDFSLKRSVDDDEAADNRAEKKRKQEEEEKKKKKNVTRGMRDLSKVNTRGMAKLTSFFKKKE